MTEANAKCAFERQRDDRYQVVFLACLGQVMRIILAGQPFIEIKRTYMRKHKLSFLIGAGCCGLCATLIFSQTLPSTLPSRQQGGIRSIYRPKSEAIERIF